MTPPHVSTDPDEEIGEGQVYGPLFVSIDDGIDELIAEKSPDTALRIYNVQDHSGGTYVRNPNHWAFARVEELTAIPPWNSESVNYKGGILISPRHLLHSSHYAIPSGSTVRFVKADNTVVTRTITANQTVSGTDFTVAILDSDVGAGISFAKVFPASIATKLPFDTLTLLPAASTDSAEDLTVRSWSFNNYPTDSGSTRQASFFNPVGDALRSPFYKPVISGDSGSPCFVFLDGQLVLLTLWHFAAAGAGDSVTSHITAINAAMTTLGGGYQLTPVDLSSYPDL